MFEKRFYVDTIDGGESVLTENGVELGLYETCEMLNDLHEEVERQREFKFSAIRQANRIDKENEQLKQQVNCHKSRIQLLSPLLDLADTIIDLSDDEKAKAFWEKRNNEVEQEWNKILKGDFE